MMSLWSSYDRSALRLMAYELCWQIPFVSTWLGWQKSHPTDHDLDQWIGFKAYIAGRLWSAGSPAFIDIYLFLIIYVSACLQCFDAVGWVAGRASSRTFLIDIPVWSEMQTCIWPS